MIFVLLGCLLYLHQIGLPGFLKNPLLDKVRARGLDVQFTRLRLRLDHGLVAENVVFGRADNASSPRLALREVDVELNLRALLKRQLQVDSLRLRQGRLTWLIPVTNGPPRELCVDDIETRLRFLPDDLWTLEHFQAQLAGARVQLTATLANASAVRDWNLLQAPSRLEQGAWQGYLRRLADGLEQIHLTAPPELIVEARGDARDWRSFVVLLKFKLPEADTPWGTLQQGLLAAQLSPAATNGCPQARIELQAKHAQTRWAGTSNLALALHLSATEAGLAIIDAAFDPAPGRIESPRSNATHAPPRARPIHSATNDIAFVARVELQLGNTTTKWGAARALRLNANLSAPGPMAAPGDASWGWWTNFAPYALAWEGQAAAVQSPQLNADEMACSGQWRAPELQVTQILARLYGGNFAGQARLDVPARRLGFSAASDFDLRKLAAWLPPEHRAWLSECSWETPPALQAQGALTLPAWTNRPPDWRAEVKPTVALSGHFHFEKSLLRGVMVNSADSRFSCTNGVWQVPDLVVKRPEGRLEVFHETDARSGGFCFRLRSSIDPRALRPLLNPRQQSGLDLFGFTQPPIVDGEIVGSWRALARTGARARVAITNFTFRGQSADGFQSAVEYTNNLLKLIEPRLQRDQGTQQLAAASVGVDVTAQRVCITNGFGTADPLVVARAIGPLTGQAFEPYRFLKPPVVRVEGTIPFHGENEGDLHCDVKGELFQWWKFKVPRITGQLHWVKDRLLLQEVQADFYRGAGTGHAEFVLQPRQPTKFSFEAKVTKADLHLLMGDLSTRTNRFEGLLTGRLEITQALASDWQSWQGRGRVNLRDGLIWEFPLFGVLSPVLDSMMPGLGSSRASEGSATFAITNGVISSDNLEIRASMMRLQYWGTIDLTGKVNARAQAELLRDTWVVGRVLSLALWPVSKIFVYKITGTLNEPRSEPVFFVPKIMLLPFQAIRALSEPMPETPAPAQRNAPPTEPP
jgi:hypothetical protein